jgi:hypothetical protein
MEIRNANDAAEYVAAWSGKAAAAGYLTSAIEGLETARAIAERQGDRAGVLDLSEALGVLRLGRLDVVQPRADRLARYPACPECGEPLRDSLCSKCGKVINPDSDDPSDWAVLGRISL